jgi:hypothetical protein
MQESLWKIQEHVNELKMLHESILSSSTPEKSKYTIKYVWVLFLCCE